MAKAKKLPSGKWRVQVFVGYDENGKNIRESFTANTKKEAERMAADWNVTREDRRKSNLTVGAAIDRYIESCELSGMSPTTIRRYKTSRKNGYPLIVGSKLDLLTISDVQRQVNSRARTVAPKTVKNDFVLLQSVVKQYKPSMSLSSVKLPAIQQTEVVIPTDTEIRTLLQESKKDRDLYVSILIASLLGLRRSEIAGLLWSDLDEKNQTLYVHQAVVRGVTEKAVIKTTKTRAGVRCLSVPDALLHELQALRNDSDRIVPVNPHYITNHFERLQKDLGMHFRFHDLRHYHASVLIAVGAPTAFITRSMGHSTPDMVQRVYGHIVGDRQRIIDAETERHTNALLTGGDFWNASHKSSHEAD